MKVEHTVEWLAIEKKSFHDENLFFRNLEYFCGKLFYRAVARKAVEVHQLSHLNDIQLRLFNFELVFSAIIQLNKLSFPNENSTFPSNFQFLQISLLLRP